MVDIENQLNRGGKQVATSPVLQDPGELVVAAESRAERFGKKRQIRCPWRADSEAAGA